MKAMKFDAIKFFKEGLWDLTISLRQYLQMSSRMHGRGREIVLKIMQSNAFWNLSCYKWKVSLGGNRKHEIVSAYKLWLQTLKLKGIAVYLFFKSTHFKVPNSDQWANSDQSASLPTIPLSFGSAVGKPLTGSSEEVIFLFTDCYTLSVEETLWELAFKCSSWFSCVLSLFHLAFVLADRGVKFGSYQVS